VPQAEMGNPRLNKSPYLLTDQTLRQC